MLRVYLLIFISTLIFAHTTKLEYTIQYFTFTKSKFSEKRYIRAIPKSLRKATHLCVKGDYIVALYDNASSSKELSQKLLEVHNLGFKQAYIRNKTECLEYKKEVKPRYAIQYFTFSKNKFSYKRYSKVIPKSIRKKTQLCIDDQYIVAFYGASSAYQNFSTQLREIHNAGFKQAYVRKRAVCREYKAEKKIQYKNVKETKKVISKPILKEPVLSKRYQILKNEPKKAANDYDNLTFHSYLDALFEFNENAQELFYKKKIDYLLNEIKKDKYGFDVFLNVYARTGSYISTQQTNLPLTKQRGSFDESSVGATINVNKILYDGSYRLTQKTYDILNKRVANIKALNAKEKLLLMGVNIYSNLYLSQEKLKLVEKMYEKQVKMQKSIEKAYNLGATSTLNYIDSKNDLLNLEKQILLLKYSHLHNEYILRHSIKAKGEKKYKLTPEKIKVSYSSLSDLQKQAIQNSSDIALESNKLKINQTNLFVQKRRYYPTLSFNSYLGYGASNDALFFKNLNNKSFSPYWQLALNVKIPLYNRGDIALQKEKEVHSILVQKNTLSLKTREILIEVERSYHSLQMIREEQDILQQQISLLYKKIKITTKLYHAGAAQYRDYSDAVKNYLAYKMQEIDLKERYIKEMFLLATLTGKRELYGTN